MPGDFSVPKLRNQSAPLTMMCGRVAERLDVVDQRRALVEALVRREGRLETRVAALALERVEQRRLLAADVGARAAVDDEAAREVRVEDALARVAARVGLADGGVEDVRLGLVLAADVDERVPCARREGADQHALDQLVRVLVHQLAVLEGPGLGLVRVAAQVLLGVAVGKEARLLAHREPRASAAAEARGLELLQDLVLVQLRECLAQPAVAAEPLVDVESLKARLVDVREEDPLAHPGASSARRRP